MFNRKTSQHGFTLLEILVALSIVAIMIGAVFKLYAQTLSMADMSRFHTLAPMLAGKKLTEFETKSSDQAISESGDFGNDFPGYSWAVTTATVGEEAFKGIPGALTRIDIKITRNQGEMSWETRAYRLLGSR